MWVLWKTIETSDVTEQWTSLYTNKFKQRWKKPTSRITIKNITHRLKKKKKCDSNSITACLKPKPKQNTQVHKVAYLYQLMECVFCRVGDEWTYTTAGTVDAIFLLLLLCVACLLQVVEGCMLCCRLPLPAVVSTPVPRIGTISSVLFASLYENNRDRF